MNEEMNELWLAMKTTKYNSVFNEIKDSFYQFTVLDDTLDKGLKLIVNAMHAEVGTFWFYDFYNTDRIIAKASSNDFDMSNISLAIGEGVAGSVIADGQAMMVSDCQKDKRWAGRVDEKTKFSTKSMICTPLYAPNSSVAFGCIQILNKVDGTLFDGADLDFANALAKEFANAFVRKYDGKIVGMSDANAKIVPNFESALSQESVEKMYDFAENSILECGYSQKEANKILRHLIKIYKVIHK